MLSNILYCEQQLGDVVIMSEKNIFDKKYYKKLQMSNTITASSCIEYERRILKGCYFLS